jgi:hypothetical protein
VRIGLSDPFGRQLGARGQFSIPVALDQDRHDGGCSCGCGDAPVPEVPDEPLLPTLTIRERARLLFTADGVPKFDWTDVLVDAPVLMFETRQELNDATGQTLVKARAVVGWTGEGVVPKETAVAWDGAGKRWEITSVVGTLPGRLELQMERLDDADS